MSVAARATTRRPTLRALALASVAPLAVACGREPPRAAADSVHASAPCLSYGPDTVRLAGTLRRLTFPGPPNFEDVAKGDEPETGFYVEPTVPICAAGGRDAELGESHAGVRQVQLVLDPAGYAALGPYVGRHVALRGTLFPSHTAHHHAPVLLDVLAPAAPVP